MLLYGDPMPDRTRCIHCLTVGFVRWENVIKGGVAYRDYFCGHCERSWRVAEQDREREDADDVPDSKRHQ
jgi:hypothetical protein